jgi:hypothetical protein
MRHKKTMEIIISRSLGRGRARNDRAKRGGTRKIPNIYG